MGNGCGADMTYTFEIDREADSWTCLDSDGNVLTTGDLPLTKSDRAVAIMEENGVGKPTSKALQAIFAKDWETVDVQ